MPSSSRYDAVVVGAGPNGLAAAITLARAGQAVLVLEAKATIGGGTRTAEITLPGYKHDICSAIHPLGLASPFFRSIPLADFGLKWIEPPLEIAHPLDDGTAVAVRRSLQETSANMGVDERAYQKLLKPLVADWKNTLDDFLGPFPLPPRNLLSMARFGMPSLQSGRGLAERTYKGERARALFAGMSAHSILPLETLGTAGFGLMMNFLAHAVGWVIPQGGSQSIADAMAAYLKSLGGEIITDNPVASLEELPQAQTILVDITPRQLLQIAGERLPDGYRRQLEKYRYGPGVFKIDYALDGPIPWKAAECAQAGTVHVGGTLEEISASEAAVGRGEHPEKPFVLVAQQSLFDPSRAPAGKQTAWAYCHVPNGSTVDMTENIEAQIERFAPGFREVILARCTHNTHEMEQYNPNYVGGDIIGGTQDLLQFYNRPVISLKPYKTPVKGLYICSSSTPPGGGVHGMCGYHAALTSLHARS